MRRRALPLFTSTSIQLFVQKSLKVVHRHTVTRILNTVQEILHCIELVKGKPDHDEDMHSRGRAIREGNWYCHLPAILRAERNLCGGTIFKFPISAELFPFPSQWYSAATMDALPSPFGKNWKSNQSSYLTRFSQTLASFNMYGSRNPIPLSESSVCLLRSKPHSKSRLLCGSQQGFSPHLHWAVGGLQNPLQLEGMICAPLPSLNLEPEENSSKLLKPKRITSIWFLLEAWDFGQEWLGSEKEKNPQPQETELFYNLLRGSLSERRFSQREPKPKSKAETRISGTF